MSLKRLSLKREVLISLSAAQTLIIRGNGTKPGEGDDPDSNVICTEGACFTAGVNCITQDNCQNTYTCDGCGIPGVKPTELSCECQGPDPTIRDPFLCPT